MRTARTTPARRLLLTLTVLAAATIACSGNPAAPGATNLAAPSAEASAAGLPAETGAPEPTTVPAATPDRIIPRVSIPPGPGVDGEVPADILDAVVSDAATRTGVAVEDVAIVTQRAVAWPNGALGCPRPGVMYTQAIEPGYQVVVEAGGQRLDYRVGSAGIPSLCENPPGPG